MDSSKERKCFHDVAICGYLLNLILISYLGGEVYCNLVGIYGNNASLYRQFFSPPEEDLHSVVWLVIVFTFFSIYMVFLDQRNLVFVIFIVDLHRMRESIWYLHQIREFYTGVCIE